MTIFEIHNFYLTIIYQVANRSVENLTKSEYRRLMIGVQLIRDPGLIYYNLVLNIS